MAILQVTTGECKTRIVQGFNVTLLKTKKFLVIQGMLKDNRT